MFALTLRFLSHNQLLFTDNKGCPIFTLWLSLSLCVFVGKLACFQQPQLSRDMREASEAQKSPSGVSTPVCKSRDKEILIHLRDPEF